MVEFRAKAKESMHLESEPQKILDEIQMIVLNQQSEFNRIWENMQEELKKEKIFLVTEKQLNREQQEFVRRYYDEEVSQNVIPLMIESIPNFPFLRDKSIYLGVVMWKKESPLKKKYALIEIPSRVLGRFIQLPSPEGEHHIILLEDVIRFNLPEIFYYFGYDQFSAHVFKVTRDAEIDIDNDIATSLIQKIEKGVRNRRKGKPVRFVFDNQMDAGLLDYLIRKLNLSRLHLYSVQKDAGTGGVSRTLSPGIARSHVRLVTKSRQSERCSIVSPEDQRTRERLPVPSGHLKTSMYRTVHRLPWS
jgi:polyphosphate kinase